MTTTCDFCGTTLTREHIGMVEQDTDGCNIVTFVCPNCGCLTDVKESEVKL